MTGETLILSREAKLHDYYIERLKEKGFKNMTITDIDKDGLNNMIREIEPELVLVEATYYECCTPYMMSELLNIFPELNIVAVNIYKYPDNIAKGFIINGCKSYVNMLEGIGEFRKGLEKAKNGLPYIAPAVKDLLDLMPIIPDPAYSITPKQEAITRLWCCGFKDNDITDILFISRSTLHIHKNEILRNFNISNNPLMIFKTALELGVVNKDELYFYPSNIRNTKSKSTRNKRRKL
jgi:DNA-binding NarL/FixJ family response regulator